MADPLEIAKVDVATVRGQLPAPVVFGDWIMESREFAVVRIVLGSGCAGWAFTLTRDGAVAEQIRKSLAGVYLGTSVEDRQRVFRRAWRRSLASHSSGAGLRALSILDLAAWDAAARAADMSVAALLGGHNARMPATAIVGYPPAETGPDEVHKQVTDLYAQGWRRFKAPVADTEGKTAARLHAVRRASPDGWVGCDAAWIYDDVESALAFLDSVADVRLGWFEDVFPPGSVRLLQRLRERSGVPVAMGDEQGGSYYPQALIDAKAVDVIRIDLTCMGGITGGLEIVRECAEAGVTFAPHMFAHVHSQVFSALGHSGVPIEWGVPWTGVDPYADSLVQPVISNGTMAPLAEEEGFGSLVNRDWILSQPHDDPEQIFAH